MRVIGRILGIVFAVLVAAIIGGAIYLQDANRLKPELESLLADNSDYTVEIKGDVSWVLLPPLTLDIAQVSLKSDDGSQNIDAASLNLKLDLSAMWEDINQWQVSELHLVDTVLIEDGARTEIKQLDILNFRLKSPTPVHLDLVHTSAEDSAPLAMTLDGLMTYFPATDATNERGATGQKIVLTDTAITSALVEGICQIEASEVLTQPISLPTPTKEDLLPLETLLNYDLVAQCDLTKLESGSETFTDTHVEITNVAGMLDLMIDVQDFMGGTLLADVGVDMQQDPIQWTVLPEVSGVDSQRMLDWNDRRLQWIAALGFDSNIKMQGNTIDALANSVNASSEFDGGQGQINIAKIKEQLMKLAAFASRSEEIANWPDMWDYQEFTGRWNINGAAQDLKFAIDNMSIDANGDYDYLTDTIDMMANITIYEPPEGSPYKINPLLQGTPIPVRCTGAAEDPQCRLDQKAAQQIVARALTSDDDSGLRKKLEQKIDEEIPEEYRETARGLLDLLGRSLSN